MELLLASTSVYRRQLLQRLGIPFSCAAPEVDETPLPGEAPRDLAGRLALAKALAVAPGHPDALVIGSDQVASLDDRAVGKPGTIERARAQLMSCSGKTVTFYTGLALACQATKLQLQWVEPFQVHFRELDVATIDSYLAREDALDCAGSFKVEGLGIALFRALEGRDQSALEGLPLIALVDLLGQAGYKVL